MFDVPIEKKTFNQNGFHLVLLVFILLVQVVLIFELLDGSCCLESSTLMWPNDFEHW